MIARLKGKVLELKPPFLILDVNGVGYEVETPLSTIFNLPKPGKEAVLHISMLVRDDAHLLFGFLTEAEKKMFQTLIKISGVGAKMALVILSGMSTVEFTHAINERDVAKLVALPGVGKKTAERLIVEMQDKLKDLGVLEAAGDFTASDMASGAKQEAIEALIALGYKASDARSRVLKVAKDDKELEDIIKQALSN